MEDFRPFSDEEAEAHFAAMTRALQANRPDTTEVRLSATHRTNMRPSLVLTDERAERIGLALQGNTHVARLDLNVVDLQLLASMNGIAHFVCGSKSLEVVRISDAQPRLIDGIPFNANFNQVWQAFADALLAAIFRNGRIKKLHLATAFGAPTFANCMSGLRTSLVELSLSIPQSNPSFLTHDTQLITEAVSSLDSLEELNLFCEAGADRRNFLVQLLNELSRVELPATVRRMCLDTDFGGINMLLAQAIRDMLRSAVHLEDFECFVQMQENLLDRCGDTIMSGLHGHPSLRCLDFFYTFVGEGSPGIVDLLENNQVLEQLTLWCQNLFGFCDTVEALGTNSTVRELTVNVENLPNGEIWESSHRRLRTLLPQVRNLENLHLELNSETPTQEDIESTLPDLLHGFEGNLSLKQVFVDYIESGSAAERSIDYFTTRNTYRPSLDNSSKSEMLSVFAIMSESHGEKPEEALSVIYDTIRVRDDWFNKIKDCSPARKTIRRSS